MFSRTSRFSRSTSPSATPSALANSASERRQLRLRHLVHGDREIRRLALHRLGVVLREGEREGLRARPPSCRRSPPRSPGSMRLSPSTTVKFAALLPSKGWPAMRPSKSMFTRSPSARGALDALVLRALLAQRLERGLARRRRSTFVTGRDDLARRDVAHRRPPGTPRRSRCTRRCAWRPAPPACTGWKRG